MKKIMNAPEKIVEQMLMGLAKSSGGFLSKIPDYDIILRTDLAKAKVSLISGGGSGHEPAHGGYVGEGMLDCAVAGPVFTSPGPDQILKGIQAVNRGQGVLMIIKNYAGDVMNFQIAGELAAQEDIATDYVIVNDDVAIGEKTQRRGIAGTVLVHKIAGAAAEQGANLSEVKAIAQEVIDNVRSKGVALKPCILPTDGQPSFNIDADKMEIGLGIHGEAGIKQVDIMASAQIAKDLVNSLAKDLPFNQGDEIVVVVNGLGATPLLEQMVFFNDVTEECDALGLKIYRALIGDYMTSLDMAGLSLSFLRLNQQLKALIDAPALSLNFRS